MNTTHLIVWALTVLGAAPSFVPALLLRHSKKLSLKELTEVHPELAWMRSEWFIVFAATISIVFCISVGVFTAIFLIGWLGQPELYFFGAFWVGTAIPNGFFAMTTGVCPVPLLLRKRYLYFYGDVARRVGLLQILSAFAIIIVYACWP